MFCPKCGEIVRDTAIKCPNCNAPLRSGNTKINADCDHKHRLPRSQPNKPCDHPHAEPDTVEESSGWKDPSFFDRPQKQESGSQSGGWTSTGPQTTITGEEVMRLLRDFFVNYRNFGGRIGKRDYWITMFFAFFVTTFIPGFLGPFALLVFLALLVPTLALTARRLHDAGEHAQVMVTLLIPVVGLIILLPTLCRDSAPDNQWGPRPAN